MSHRDGYKERSSDSFCNDAWRSLLVLLLPLLLQEITRCIYGARKTVMLWRGGRRLMKFHRQSNSLNRFLVELHASSRYRTRALPPVLMIAIERIRAMRTRLLETMSCLMYDVWANGVCLHEACPFSTFFRVWIGWRRSPTMHLQGADLI